MNSFYIFCFSESEYIPAIINDPPISDISFNRAISVDVVSVPDIRCGICIVIIKMKRRIARQRVDNLTYFFVIMLMLAAMSIKPVRIITYPVFGINEVSIPK
jgi:hypothetical protein